MFTLGIIACRMFEDELLYLIEKDKDLDQIFLLDNGEPQKTFLKKLNILNKNPIFIKIHDLFQEIKNIKSSKTIKTTLIIEIIELRLHDTPKLLKEQVYEETTKFRDLLNPKCILLCYGLCGNVLGDVEEELSTDRCHVSILKEKNGNIVDDCIAATVGGRENYLQLLKSFHSKGTLIFTPMYAITYNYLITEKFLEMGESLENMIRMNKIMFKMCNYTQVCLLETRLSYTLKEEVYRKTKELAETYNFEILYKTGGKQDLFIENYNQIKKYLKLK